jgi:hypothetical protein
MDDFSRRNEEGRKSGEGLIGFFGGLEVTDGVPSLSDQSSRVASGVLSDEDTSCSGLPGSPNDRVPVKFLIRLCRARSRKLPYMKS